MHIKDYRLGLARFAADVINSSLGAIFNRPRNEGMGIVRIVATATRLDAADIIVPMQSRFAKAKREEENQNYVSRQRKYRGISCKAL